MLYDVIGILQDVVKTQMGGGGKKSCANITLHDEPGNVIEVALWDDYGKQFMNYNNSNKNDGPTILILTHAWCKKNSASGLPSLSNAWNGSRLHINLDHPQVQCLKSSGGSIQLSTASSHSLSQTCDSSVQSTNKSWTSPNEVKTLRHINELGKDCFATTIGTTKRFKSSKFGWYFESCPACKTSNKSHGKNFECICGVKDVEPITKFKIEVEVDYDNHVGCFVFWDKDCIPFIQMTALKLRQLMKEAGEDNPKIYPAQLDKLLNKELAFQVKYQSFFQQYSVVTIIKDDDVYKTLKNLLNTNEHTSNAENLNLDTSIPMELQDPPFKTPTGEYSISAQPSNSANQTWSPSTSSNNTPAKRVAISVSLDKLIQNEVLTPKHSTTKAKHPKKE